MPQIMQENPSYFVDNVFPGKPLSNPPSPSSTSSTSAEDNNNTTKKKLKKLPQPLPPQQQLATTPPPKKLPFYANLNFSTFFSPTSRRRRNSSSFSSTTSNGSSSTSDGYLKPKAPPPGHSEPLQRHYYVNGRGYCPPSSPLTPITPTSPPGGGGGWSRRREDPGFTFVEVYTPTSSPSGCSIEETTFSRGYSNSNNESTTSTITLPPICATPTTLLFNNGPPSLPTPPPYKKDSFCEPFCTICATYSASKGGSKVNDVGILKSSECFFSRNTEALIRQFFDNVVATDQNNQLKIAYESYDVRDLDKGIEVVGGMHSSRVQILIISPHLLDRLKHDETTRKKLNPLNRILRSNKTLAVLINITPAQILQNYLSLLPKFPSWTVCPLTTTSKMDIDFCEAFSSKFLTLYNGIQGGIQEIQTRKSFSIFPKKVTMEQPKVMVLLRDPLDLEDEDRVEFLVGKGGGKDKEKVGFTFLNPYTIFVRIPPHLFSTSVSSLLNLHLYMGGNKIGSHLLKLDHKGGGAEEEDEEVEVFEEEKQFNESGFLEPGPSSLGGSGSETSELSALSTNSSSFLNQTVPNYSDYDFPRVEDQDYRIPEPGARRVGRPIVPKKPERRSSGTQV